MFTQSNRVRCVCAVFIPTEGHFLATNLVFFFLYMEIGTHLPTFSHSLMNASVVNSLLLHAWRSLPWYESTVHSGCSVSNSSRCSLSDGKVECWQPITAMFWGSHDCHLWLKLIKMSGAAAKPSFVHFKDVHVIWQVALGDHLGNCWILCCCCCF